MRGDNPRSALAWLTYGVLCALATLASCMAHAAPMPVPPCWPGLTNAATGYRGASLVIGEGPACRWANWFCLPSDAANPRQLPVTRPAIVGPKTVEITTILGRMLTIERTTDANRPSVFTLMWKAYVTDPANDAVLSACVTEMKANP